MGKTYYRNVRGKYHRDREDWVQSGRAVCGADIRRPAFTLTDDGAFRQACEHSGVDFDKQVCKHCRRREDNER